MEGELDARSIGYARPRRVKPGMFAGWYVTIGALNLIVAAVEVGGASLAFVGMAISVMNGQTRWSHLLAWDLGALPAFALLCGGMTAAGSIGSFWRLPWSLRVVRAGLAGDVLLSGYVAVVVITQATGLRGTIALVVTGTAIARFAYVAFALWAYGNIRADFYFQRSTGRPPTVLGVELASVPQPRATGSTPRLTPSAGRFEVVGTDASSGEFVRFTSRAATESLARRSAVAQGLSEGSVHVRPLPVDP